MQKMNKEMKTKWVAALRSGDYAQGAGRLRDAKLKEFCCLGVLCDVSGLGVWDAEGQYAIGDNKDDGVLPVVLANEYGLDCSPVMYIDSDDQDDYPCTYEMDIVELNDDGGYTFNQLADLIEEQL